MGGDAAKVKNDIRQLSSTFSTAPTLSYTASYPGYIHHSHIDIHCEIDTRSREDSDHFVLCEEFISFFDHLKGEIIDWIKEGIPLDVLE